MQRWVLWIEGVDFDDTLFDSQKLSVIRGASRALEEMAFVAHKALEDAVGLTNLRRITAGASQAGFTLAGGEVDVRAALVALMARLGTQGFQPADVEPVAQLDKSKCLPLGDTSACAPFAHLKFHGFVEAYDDAAEDAMDIALNKARAQVRVAQLRDPGVRGAFSVETTPVVNPAIAIALKPCEFDRTRPRETRVMGPFDGRPDSDPGEQWSPREVSRSSGARWHFGRALRQRLYEHAREQYARENPRYSIGSLAFADDFQELTATPLPQSGGEDLPVSVRRKIAVFAGDGDQFTKLREALTDKNYLGQEAGLATLTLALETKMRALLDRLVLDLEKFRFTPGWENVAEVNLLANDTSARRTEVQEEAGIVSLLRFETLLFGGEDVTFVAPAWLGWWLAVRFFEITKDWTVGDAEIATACAQCARPVPDRGGRELPMRFSAGLVFCSAKTPIRAAKKLAEDLCHLAKDSGYGLEVEALESVEPPFDGPESLRDRLYGPEWREKGTGSRLTIRREHVARVCRELQSLWVGDAAFPASQAYGALRKGRDAGSLASMAAGKQVAASLENYSNRAGARIANGNFKTLPGERLGLQLAFALQQRDYVKGAGGWTDVAAGLPERSS